MIDISKLCFEYPDGDIPVFRDFSMHVEKGEFVLLTGESGSGKSTLLNLLLKELEPDFGRITVNGTDISTVTELMIPEYRRKLGVVFQNAKLFDDLTVYENLELVLQMMGTKKSDAEKRISSVLKMMCVDHLYKRYPKQLSGGEKQKVCMARALINYPLVILADEPTGNLDPAASLEIFRLMEVIHRQGTTIIMATHDYDTVNSQSFTHRIIKLEETTAIFTEDIL